MQADRHQRAVRLHLVEALPGLADVLAAIERAVLRRGRHAQARIDRLGVLRRDADVAAVGERRIAVDPQILPGLALVLAAEQAHAHRDDDGVGIGRAGADRVAVEHAFGLGVADQLAAQPRLLLRQADQMLAAIAPAFAAVGRAHHAADLQHRENFPGILGCGANRITRQSNGILARAAARDWACASSSRRHPRCETPRPASRRPACAWDRPDRP